MTQTKLEIADFLDEETLTEINWLNSELAQFQQQATFRMRDYESRISALADFGLKRKGIDPKQYQLDLRPTGLEISLRAVEPAAVPQANGSGSKEEVK